LVAQSGQDADRAGERDAGRDERLERVDELEPLDPHGADLADARRGGGEAGRLEVEDDELRLLERRIDGRRRERDGAAVPPEPRVATDELVDQRPREALRRVSQGEEPSRRLGRRQRAVLLDELDETVDRVEREL